MYQLYSIIGDQDALKQKYTVQRPIGSGGESVVYQVSERDTGNQYALVVNRELKRRMSPDYEKPLITRMLANQEINCHQAKIFSYFWIESKNLGKNKETGEPKHLVFVYQDRQDGDLLTRYFDNDQTATTFRHRAYLLELGVCSLDSTQYRELVMSGQINHQITTFMIWISNLSFSMAGIFHRDCKGRNHILVKTSDCTYKGHSMADFDYWAYHLVEDLTIFIPQQEYVVKRIDYIDWAIGEQAQYTVEECKRILLAYLEDPLLLEELLEKPVSDNVLNIYPNVQFQELHIEQEMVHFTNENSIPLDICLKNETIVSDETLFVSSYCQV